MQGHVAAVLILLSQVARRNFQLIEPYVPLLTGLAVEKWTSQCANLTEFFVRLTLWFGHRNNFAGFSVGNCK